MANGDLLGGLLSVFGSDETKPTRRERVKSRKQLQLEKVFKDFNVPVEQQKQILALPEAGQDVFLNTLAQNQAKQIGVPRTRSDQEVLTMFPNLDPGIVSQLSGRDVSRLVAQRARQQTKGRGSKSRVNRQGLIEALPQNARELVGGLTDSGVNRLTQRLIRNKISPKFRRKRGAPKLRIKQDANFRKSGLKSGDTVCIRIP